LFGIKNGKRFCGSQNRALIFAKNKTGDSHRLFTGAGMVFCIHFIRDTFI